MGRENEEARLVNILHPHAVYFRNSETRESIDQSSAAMDYVWEPTIRQPNRAETAQPLERALLAG